MPTQNDIPVAHRVSSPAKVATRQPVSKSNTNVFSRSLQSIPWWAYVLAFLAFLSPLASARIWFALNNSILNNNSASAKVADSNAVEVSDTASKTTNSNLAPSSKTTPISVNSQPLAPESDAPPNLFGHYAFAEAPAQKLRTISKASDGYEIRLRDAAAKSYLQMEADAKAEGVNLTLISGFRSIADQQQLFFDISKERNQTPSERAKVSAPPGHSEHHTGYAVDIGDADLPSANLSTSFEKTAAFQWLKRNAARYGFEISFPKDNSQGVAYEPWHWRFVGDDESLATFYKKSNQDNSFLKR